jgi:hypothetical protein
MEVYIDDVVVKLDGFEEHMTDLKLSLERMKKYELRMNPLKCAFGVTPERFLGCKKDVQKLLGKINYLHRFISNL